MTFLRLNPPRIIQYTHFVSSSFCCWSLGCRCQCKVNCTHQMQYESHTPWLSRITIVDLIKLWLGVSEKGYCIIWKGEAHKRWLHCLIEFSYVCFFSICFFFFNLKRRQISTTLHCCCSYLVQSMGGFHPRALTGSRNVCIIDTLALQHACQRA